MTTTRVTVAAPLGWSHAGAPVKLMCGNGPMMRLVLAGGAQVQPMLEYTICTAHKNLKYVRDHFASTGEVDLCDKYDPV